VINAALMFVVIGVVLLALAVDLAAIGAWLRRRLR
jgi:hypothetical protein